MGPDPNDPQTRACVCTVLSGFEKEVDPALRPISTAPKNFDNYGEQSWMGGINFQAWDVQNDHATFGTTANPTGVKIFWDKEIPERYRDVTKYGTPAGLATVMR